MASLHHSLWSMACLVLLREGSLEDEQGDIGNLEHGGSVHRNVLVPPLAGGACGGSSREHPNQ